MDPKVYTVSELNQSIKFLLDTTYGTLWVEGEISGFKVSSLGHMYFDLKDADSLVSCVIYKGFAAHMEFDPENGLLVKVRASVTIYAKQSKYQLNVKELIPMKMGPLQIAFEQLKKKLEAEGLFSSSRKRILPKLPRKIGIVTSMQGAAIRDILSILKRRYSNLHIIIAPVKVQGPGAKEEIAEAISTLNDNFKDMDVLLVGRGGGSMEDLWAFNEEIVARAIAGSRIPVISCVGHETDFTIADFTADLRAPTPSAAAELVVQNKEELVRHIRQLNTRLVQSLRIFYEHLKGRFTGLAGGRMFRNPELMLEARLRRVDEAAEALFNNAERRARIFEEKLKLAGAKLNALNPEFPLSKGYAIATLADGWTVVKDAGTLKQGQILSVRFRKGRAETEVLKMEE
ncbi:MAG: exodeoxyribonuclease VII large subunit [Elusimicrobia bacterium RIFOXYA12_FULL_51_18]|nr:MAG: exodeoxyribonuclease VII large subunit [Elusimicrobia bacterium RIFOXYA12_FULL_51_18]OGS31521.1 MAG: exodeoxyribonuclease VII large subunit [Elusimicrobia bacterium RIFOXYA2_FULL_53_38]